MAKAIVLAAFYYPSAEADGNCSVVDVAKAIVSGFYYPSAEADGNCNVVDVAKALVLSAVYIRQLRQTVIKRTVFDKTKALF